MAGWYDGIKRTVTKARKFWKCSICEEGIKPGEKYVYEVGDVRYCIKCAAEIRAKEDGLSHTLERIR